LTGILNSDYFSYDGKNQLKSASLSGEESLTGNGCKNRNFGFFGKEGKQGRSNRGKTGTEQ